MIRPCALFATLGLLLAPAVAKACPESSLSCIPKYHLALTQESHGALSVRRGSGSTTAVGLGLGADFFPIDNLSVGMRADVRAVEEGGAAWSVAWGVGVRAGYNIPFSRRWSFWPRVGFGFDNTPRLVLHPDFPNVPNNESPLLTAQNRLLSFELTAPVVVHPNRNFFLGFGPRLTLPVYAHDDGIGTAAKPIRFGLQLLLGGHF